MSHIIIVPPAFADNIRAMARKVGEEEDRIHGIPIITSRHLPPDTAYLIPATDVVLRPEKSPWENFLEDRGKDAYRMTFDYPYQFVAKRRPTGWRRVWLLVVLTFREAWDRIAEWWNGPEPEDDQDPEDE